MRLIGLNKYWSAFPALRDSLFAKNNNGYYEVKTDNIKAAIMEHKDIKQFKDDFSSSFSSFTGFLKDKLLGNVGDLAIAKMENTISEDIFSRLGDSKLIDKYDAYQILDDKWGQIAIDLEIIQTEGFGAAKKVDPNLIIKKKDKKEYEVQDGWIGRIFPFELIQSTILKEQYQSLADKEAKLSEIASTYEEILDSLTEEEKESNVVNDDKDAFVSAEITKEAKKIKAENKGVKFDENSFEYKVLKVAELIAEEKSLKSKIKKESADLQNNTKETIEKLTDEQAMQLLETKWITPLVEELHNLPETIVNDLASKIKSLSEKYAITFAEVENDISKTEKELSAMINDLTGDESDMKGLAELKKLLGE